jgi:UDP-GlcNAc3NAcA epimerase
MKMIKLLTIIGARPQIIKAAAISRAIKNHFQHQIVEVIVHTGQHYDQNMSDVFFEELQIPKPNYNLNVGSGKHGVQTAKMITGIEDILEQEQPNYIILYGDTNSTLAGTIAASKIHIPIVHIEAGLRSFNKKMPEEINRILTDHCSTFLFPPTQTGVDNLVKEGFSLENKNPFTADKPLVENVGDVMFDNSLFFASLTNEDVLKNNHLEKNNYILTTIHRNNNTDDSVRLSAICESLIQIANDHLIEILLPLHPRTQKLLETNLKADLCQTFLTHKSIKIVPPVSFLEMITLESNAKLIITDSGGVQKESYFFKKPCIILRSETEWVEIVESGSAFIADANKTFIVNKARELLDNNAKYIFPNLYGEGNAAEKILRILINNQA